VSRESIDLDIKQYLLILKRRSLLIVSITLSTFLLSVPFAILVKPTYEASGKLLFKVPTFQVIGSTLLPNGSESAGDLKSLISTQNPITTQIEVITSPAIMQKVVEKLQLKDKKGQLIEPEALAANIKLKIISGTDVLLVSYQSRKAQETAAVVNAVMDFYLKNDISTNRFEAESTHNFLNKQLTKADTAVHGAEIALRRFKEQNRIIDLIEETKSSVSIIGDLGKEINTLQGQLADLTSQTWELHQKIGLNSQTAITLSSLSRSPAIQGILTQLQEVDRQLAVEGSRFSETNPTIISLAAKKANLQALLQQQILQTAGYSIKVRQGLLQPSELREKLIQDFLQVELQRNGLTKRLDSLYTSRRAYLRRVEVIPRLAQIQRELEQKSEISQSNYQTIFKKVEELRIAENKNIANNARIISNAKVPKKPSGSKKSIILTLGLLLGLFLSMATVMVLEMKDKSLKTLKDIRNIFEYTLLGMIPQLARRFPRHETPKRRILPLIFPRYQMNKMDNTTHIIVRDEPYSLASEMYRMIQANLRFLTPGEIPKTIMITSAISQEGKSTVSANLATVIAQLGRRVLLVDANMRLPNQHYLWQITNLLGLSDILAGHAEYINVICQVMENLDILTGGTRPPNPLALLDSQRMASLIAEFSTNYDFVIIDTPSLLIGADSLTLSQMTDGVLLVTRPGIIDSQSAKAAKDMLKRSNCNILGLLVNGVIEKNESNSCFYHPNEEYLIPQKTSEKV